METMQGTMLRMCEEIQGCVFGYTQSDEITLVLTDYKTIKTDAWFGYNIQKMASISASIATLEFNKLFHEKCQEAIVNAVLEGTKDENENVAVGGKAADRASLLARKVNKAMFDSRCFSIPKDEVCNCLIWRQKDATRNSIESVGQAYFSQSKLNGKNCDQIQDMLFTEKGINWNDFPTDCKRGAACYRIEKAETIQDPRNHEKLITVNRRPWVIDCNIPVFSQDREFVERWL